MGVLQVTLNVLDFGMTMLEAVSAPRFSATSNVIDLSNRIPRSAEGELVGLHLGGEGRGEWCGHE